MITANELRRKFVDFFCAQEHEHVASSSLVPRDDPSLLFTNSGMVQFKKIFQGQEKRAYIRAVTSQKCLRVGGKHNDLENVGRTARHHTFFEMLGNFSFGDYFKEKAISMAWNFLTVELKLPVDRLHVSVFETDDEAEELWKKITGIPAERIHRMGEKDNFWSMGDTGPCGPCSEIYIDQGEQLSCGPNCKIGHCECDRFLEIWNLVFMQYNQLESGERVPLPKPSIDTGMGLERITAVCQGVYSNFDSDLFQDIILFTADMAKCSYSHSLPDANDTDTALRVIADHSRSIAFMIADGIMPSNEGRGYVLRRLIRRAYRFGRLINMPETFLHKTSKRVCEIMGADYPELRANEDFMCRVIFEEETRFSRTLDKGLALLEDELTSLKQGANKHISGAIAFRLYDTYGFPLDIINDVVEKHGVSVDETGFHEHMQAQKNRAKAAWKGSGEKDLASRFALLLEDGLESTFTGYSGLGDSSRIIALLDADAHAVDKLSQGETGYLVAGKTPFYGASGGQIGDIGSITTPMATVQVTDTLKPMPSLTVHHITVNDGEVLLDAEATLAVSENSRLAAARNHTCTHLLQTALREVLGMHIRQAGSSITTDRLRFDFTHISAMTDAEILAVEAHVTRAIIANICLEKEEMLYTEAMGKGAMGLFGEKYGDTVRVVTVPGESIELCGGTHLHSTGQIGSFSILSESGISAGVRRIEAITGLDALAHTQAQRTELQELSGLLKSHPGELAGRVKNLYEENRNLRKNMEKAAAQSSSALGKDALEKIRTVNAIPLLTIENAAPNLQALRRLMDDLRSKMPSGVVCLSCVEDDNKVLLLIAVSKDLLQTFTASALAKEISSLIGGSGGGRADLAQAGGTIAEGVQKAFAALEAILKK